MSEREAFVKLAELRSATMSGVCRRLGISRKTGYKWLRRYGEDGLAGLFDRSRRPHGSPPPAEYGPDDRVRKVQGKGELYFRGKA